MQNILTFLVKSLFSLFLLCFSLPIHAQFIDKTPINIPVDGKKDWVLSKVDFPLYNRLGHVESGFYGDNLSKWAAIGVPNLDFPPSGSNLYGFFANNQSDRVFLGLRDDGINQSNAILAFGDNHDNNPVPDRLIFKFDSWDPLFSKEISTMLANGNVGIGTASPLFKFHLHDGIAMISGANSGGGPMVIFSSDLTTHPFGQWGIEYEPNERGLNFWKPFGNPGGGLPGNFYMFLSDIDGAVSIGTKNSPTLVGTNNTSSYRLFVKGGILADEVLVQTGWADYVFDNEYHLPSLEDVEKYIKEQGHLPNVPSEKEVVENGLELGKMSVTQQEKIEELFLYVIQLNKDIQTLRDENESLRHLVKALKIASDEK